MKIQADPFSETFHEVGIQHVEISRVERDYKREKEEGPPPTLNQLIQFIIDKYNEKEEGVNFDEVKLPEGHWIPKDHNGFNLKVYQCVVPIFSAAISMLGKLGVEVENSREVSFLFLLYRIHEKTREIFALCMGKRGFLPVFPYADYTFPKTIAIRLLDPEHRSKEQTKQVTGSVLTSQVTLRSNLHFDPSLIHKIYNGFCARLRRDASLLALSEFRNVDQLVPEKPAEIEIKKSVIRIHKSFSFETFPRILNHFSKIYRGEVTHLYPSKTEEQGSRDKFAFLEYFTAVPSQTRAYLENQLLEKIAEYLRDDKNKFELDLCHPRVEDYYRASEFCVRYSDKSRKVKVIQLSGSRITFAQLVIMLRKMANLNLDQKGLVQELKHVTLGMKWGKKWKNEPLLNCLIGQMRIQTKEGDKTYFKFNRAWYQISQNLLDRVAQEFKRLMVDCKLSEDHEAQLRHPWHPKGLNLTLTAAAKDLKVTEDEVKNLCEQQVQFVGDDGTVLFWELEGEILLHPLVFHYKDSIVTLLQGYDSITEKEFIDIAGETLGPKLWDQLTQKRKIGEIVEVSINGTKTPIVRLNNPLFEEGKPWTPGQVALLKKWGATSLYTMEEGDYNEGYLYDVMNREGGYKPFDLRKGGWLVGDRICPEGIELFDILQITEEAIYIYHVKEGFGQKTRDACSQILNSARMFHEQKAILETFYEMATNPKKEDGHSEYRKKVALQLKALGKDAFLKLFENKPHVFVYAFVDERKTEHVVDPRKETFAASDFSSKSTAKVANSIFTELKKSQYLTKEGKKGEKFSDLYAVSALSFQDAKFDKYKRFVWEVLCGDIAFLGSLIGRMDLLHTRAQVEGMGYGFKVCQIRRPFSVATEDVTPGLVAFKGKAEDIEDFKEIVHEKVFFYHTPWSEVTEYYVPLTTLGDGSCGIHAVLGEKKDGVIQVEDPANIRSEFVGFLRDDLNATGDGFGYAINQTLYEANLKSLIDEASKPDDPESELRTSAKMVFQNIDDFEEYKKTDYQKKVLQEEKKILEQAKPQGKVIKKLKEKTNSSKTLVEFKASLEASDPELHRIFTSSVSDLTTLSQDSSSYKWMGSHLDAISKIRKEENEAKEAFLTSADVMENFLTCLENPDYWLTTDEVQLLGEHWDLRVEILCEDTIGGDYGCTNMHTLPHRDDDNRELVVVYADGHHYSRCVPF